MEAGRLWSLSGCGDYLGGSQRDGSAYYRILSRFLPEGFCGYYAEERDGKLYVGFRFSAVFGFFATGDFDITIPVKGEINEVILKTRMNETSLWRAQTGFLPQSEQYGVYVKLERNDVYSLSMSCEGFDGGMNNADLTAIESGEYIFMDNDIMIASKEANSLLMPMWRKCI